MEIETVSIVIPMYNSSKTIERTLSSVLLQSYQNIEIIVIDDGSNDNSQQICKRFVTNKKIFLVSQENAGPAAARNRGVKMAKGRYITFVDSDDYLETNHIENLVRSIKNSQMAICGFFEVYDHCKKIFCLKNGIISQVKAQKMVLENQSVGGYLWNKLFLTDLIIKKAIKFDEHIFVGEDMLFLQQYLSYCDTVAIIKEATYNYSIQENSISHHFHDKTISKLFALEKVYFILDNKTNKDIVIREYMSQYLSFYEWLEDKEKLESCFQVFQKKTSLKTQKLFKLLRKQDKIKFLIYLINSKAYIYLMKLIRKYKGTY